MTKAKAQSAIDEAFTDGLKMLFGVMVSNLGLAQTRDDALIRFERGVSIHDDAHSKASVAIDRIFPE